MDLKTYFLYNIPATDSLLLNNLLQLIDITAPRPWLGSRSGLVVGMLEPSVDTGM